MFTLLLSAITRPSKAFAELFNVATWRVVLAVSALNLLAAGVGLLRFFEKTHLDYLGKGVPVEKAGEAAAILSISTVVIGAVLVPFLIWFLEALVIHLANLFFLSGKESSFGLFYRLAALAWLPIMLGNLTKSLLTFTVPLNRMEQVQTGLGIFFPAGQSTGFWYYLLSMVDPFVIWHLVLLALGAGILTGVPSRKYGLLLFFCWMVLIVAYAFSGGNVWAEIDLQYHP